MLATLVASEGRAASNVVQYTYDPAGNIVAIRRANPVLVAIADFFPTSGSAGTQVAITGTGFAATPAGNAVTFGGVTALVVSATATSLTVAVPFGATTGKIAVSVAGNSATTVQDFAVVAPGAPTISGLSPGTAPAGTQVSVTGTNFNPAVGATTVKLNETVATVVTATPTQLTIVVPPSTGSGKVRVATSAGTAVSSSDFIVPPPSIAIADIVASARVSTSGAAQSIGLYAANKVGLILFDGNAGDWLSLQFANFAINPAASSIAYTVYKPDNTQLSSGSLSATNLTIHVPTLPAAGTYTVALRSGATQVSLDAQLETSRLIPGDGSMLDVARGVGQSARALISAAGGEQRALMVSGIANAPVGTAIDWTVTTPSATTLKKGVAFGLGSTTLLPAFVAPGTYTVVLGTSSPTSPVRYQLALLAGTALPIDGPAQPVTIAAPGAGARFNFAGVAGESLGLGVTGLVLAPTSATYTAMAVFKPDATQLTAGNCSVDGTQCALNFPNLSVSGTYSIIVQPSGGATGTLQAWLSHDVPGVLAVGTPKALALARPGQNANLTFAGTVGQTLRLSWSGVAIAGSTATAIAIVFNPDGSTLSSARLSNAIAGAADIPALPATGTYSILIDPPGAATMNATLTLTTR